MTLKTFLQSCIDSLKSHPESIFSWEGHQWKHSSDKLRGYSPFRPIADQKSGTSFTVWKNDLRWLCAGTGLGGNPIHYLARLDNATFPLRGNEFIKYAKQLGEIAGVPFPENILKSEDYRTLQKIQNRQLAIALACQFSEEILWDDSRQDSRAARAYLIEQRGLSAQEIKEAQFGYFRGSAVLDRLLDAGLETSLLEEVGLFYPSKSGKGYFSPLEGYLICPWFDADFNYLNIYARYPGKPPGNQTKTKSLKTPNGEYIKPKSVPFYFNQAIANGHKDLVVVEGLLDAVTAQVRGDSSVVAWVAAHPSAEQLESIKRYGIKSITYCLDPDSAGDAATAKSMGKLYQLGIQVFVAPRLPDGQDPDEFINANGIQAWRGHIEQKISGFRYLARSIAPKSMNLSDTDRHELELKAKEAISFVANIPESDRPNSLISAFWEELSPYGISPASISYQSNKAEADDLGIIAEITHVLENTQRLAERTARLEGIRQKYNYSNQAFQKIVDTLSQSDEGITEYFAAERLTDSLRLDITKILPQNLGELIQKTAENQHLDPMQYLHQALPVWASLIGKSSKLWLKNGFIAPAILWTALIMPSGFGKSTSMAYLKSGLNKRQSEAKRKFEAEKERVALVEHNWKCLSRQEKAELLGTDADPMEPSNRLKTPRTYVVNEGQMEGIYRLLRDQEESFLWEFDELSSMLSGMDQYKSAGKGNSRGKLLGLYDGANASVVYADSSKNFDIEDPCISIAGNIQPAKISKTFNVEDDVDGLLARFLVYFPEIKPNYIWEESDREDRLQEALDKLTDALEAMELGECYLSPSAKKIWKPFIEECKKKQYEAKDAEASFAAFMGRLPSHVARIALVLHHLHIALNEYESTQEIPGEVMAKAVRLGAFYLMQYRKLQRQYQSYSDSLPALLRDIQAYALSKGGFLVSLLRDSSLAKKLRKQGLCAKTETLISYLQKLEDEGLGKLTGKGGSAKYTPFAVPMQKKKAPETIPLLEEVRPLLESIHDSTEEAEEEAHETERKLEKVAIAQKVKVKSGIFENIPADTLWEILEIQGSQVKLRPLSNLDLIDRSQGDFLCPINALLSFDPLGLR